MHTWPPERTVGDRWEWEFDLAGTVADVHAVLPEALVVGVRGEPREMMDVVAREVPDVVFNLCEAPLTNPRLEAHAAALFEWLGVPFTGSGSETLTLCRRKDVTKSILGAAGIRVPRSAGFPCIVKPADEDGSAGIYPESICDTDAEVARARSRLGGAGLVEEFLPGREFVVSLWGRLEPEHRVIGEIAYAGGVRLLTYEGKWDMESYGYVNAPLVFHPEIDATLEARLLEAAGGAWRALGLRGYGSVDLRLDGDGAPCVIDVNPNAALNAEGRLYRSVEATGWTWEQFITRQLEWAR